MNILKNNFQVKEKKDFIVISKIRGQIRNDKYYQQKKKNKINEGYHCCDNRKRIAIKLF